MKQSERHNYRTDPFTAFALKGSAQPSASLSDMLRNADWKQMLKDLIGGNLIGRSFYAPDTLREYWDATKASKQQNASAPRVVAVFELTADLASEELVANKAKNQELQPPPFVNNTGRDVQQTPPRPRLQRMLHNASGNEEERQADEN